MGWLEAREGLRLSAFLRIVFFLEGLLCTFFVEESRMNDIFIPRIKTLHLVSRFFLKYGTVHGL